MKLNSHLVYVLVVLAGMAVSGLLIGELGNDRAFGLGILTCLIIPASIILAGRVGRLTYAGLTLAGLSLWALAWISIFLVLRNLVLSAGSDFTWGATLAFNWPEMLISAIAFVGVSI